MSTPIPRRRPSRPARPTPPTTPPATSLPPASATAPRTLRRLILRTRPRTRRLTLRPRLRTVASPPPPGYHPPPPWPARRERARYANVDLPALTVAKLAASQDPVHARGEWLVFPKGAGNYVEQLERVVPLRGGAVRTALDIGCGVASFGDYLLSYGVLTMSIAPRERHGAHVQFALERGLPAMIGVLGARRLPYPSRSFDMAHCADCHVSWTAHADSRWAVYAGN